jgi:AcrR family transcriptional regulator
VQGVELAEEGVAVECLFCDRPAMASDVETSLRARKRAKTRQALLKAARVLFRRRGFEETTIDEIAARAQVSRRTFFRYFPSKTDLVFPNAEERLRWFEGVLQEGADETAVGMIQRGFSALAAEFSEHAEELVTQQELVEACPPLLARQYVLDREWEAVLTRTLVPHVGEDQAPLWAGALFGVMTVVLRRWFAGGAQEDLATLGHDGLQLVAGTLSAAQEVTTP